MMSEWTNPDGSHSVGIREDFKGFPKEVKDEPKEEAVVEKKKPAKKASKKK